MKNKLFIFESTEWTRVRSAAAEHEEIFDPAFIALLPANSQATLPPTAQASAEVRRRSDYSLRSW